MRAQVRVRAVLREQMRVLFEKVPNSIKQSTLGAFKGLSEVALVVTTKLNHQKRVR